MKKRILILSLMLFLSTPVFAQYNGGNADGFDTEAILNTTLNNISLVILYQGGNGDGHDVEDYFNTTLTNISLEVLFAGGNGDGHDIESLLNTTLDNTSLIVLYGGGNGDGHDIEALINTTLENISLAVLYDGGNGDGHDVEALLNTTLNNTSLVILYNGGNGDGHDVEALLNTTLNNISLAILYNGGNADGFSSSQETVFLDPNQIVDLALNIKALLQGATINPSDPNLMNDVLRAGGLIPIATPYSDFATIDPAVLNNGGALGTGVLSDNIVDWVWIEIRSTSDNTFIVDDTSALIQRDGDIVSMDGLSNVILEGFTDSYFVVVKHRNHLGVMTANPISLTTAATNIDFTNSATPTFGSNAQVQAPGSPRALWAGNVNGDTIIQYSGTTPDSPSILSEVLNDPGNILNFATYMVNGYNVHDVNMDGNTQYSGISPDTPILLQNALAHPENFINFSTYQIKEQLPEN